MNFMIVVSLLSFYFFRECHCQSSHNRKNRNLLRRVRVVVPCVHFCGQVVLIHSLQVRVCVSGC